MDNCNTLQLNEQWYISLIDDCKDIITEAVYVSRWALIEGYHQLGERIVTDTEYKKWEQNKAGVVLKGLAKELNMSERIIYYAIEFYNKYPELNNVPEGKNITWNKIITKYLPQKEGKQDIEEVEKVRGTSGMFASIEITCPYCNKVFSYIINKE